MRAPRVLLILLALAAAPASAQKVENVRLLLEHMSDGISGARTGDWATYRVYGGQADRTSYWRLAVVGAEKDRFNRDALWVEIEMGTHPKMVAPLFQTRLLVAQDLNDKDTRPAITRMYMAWGVEKVRELDDAALAKILTPDTSSAAPEENNPAVNDALFRITVGEEKRLMTLAGTVPAVPTVVHYGSTVIKRIWISREVPLIHLVKIEIPAVEYALEIREYGRDARPRMILPVDGAPRLTLENGGPFNDSTLFPNRIKDAIQAQRAADAKGATDAP